MLVCILKRCYMHIHVYINWNMKKQHNGLLHLVSGPTVTEVPLLMVLLHKGQFLQVASQKGAQGYFVHTKAQNPLI